MRNLSNLKKVKALLTKVAPFFHENDWVLKNKALCGADKREEYTYQMKPSRSLWSPNPISKVNDVIKFCQHHGNKIVATANQTHMKVTYAFPHT